MTEKEAIEVIKSNMPTSGYYMLRKAIATAISALGEIQQYREIGTVEECRAAVKKLGTKIDKPKCEDCLFLEDKERGRKGAVIGTCRLKHQNGRRYGKSAACRFFELDYERLEGNDGKINRKNKKRCCGV